MISIVCVYNNRRILQDILLKSLENQTVKYELITLDNTNNRFKSAAQALNHGGEKAQGKYIIFAHQDMRLGYNSYLEDAEKILKSIPDLGIAGVAGVKGDGSIWKERIKYSIDIYDNTTFDKIKPVDKPEEVQTLDECLLIVPGAVFNKIKFDEKTFDGWDCYGADYCLAVKQYDLKAYVIPGSCGHCNLRSKYDFWNFKQLNKYQIRLFNKYKNDYKVIYTFLGDINRKFLLWGKFLYFFKPVYKKIFPDLELYLRKELKGNNTILDLGCGHLSPIYKHDINFTIGVDIFEASLRESKRLNIHTQYLLADIYKLEFKPGSFDAVVAIDILENLTKEEGLTLIKKMDPWAKRKIIIKTSNGFVKQAAYNNNRHQEHKSGWTAEDFKNQGFNVHGIGGWKYRDEQSGQEGIPEYSFWRERINNLTHRFLYHFPSNAAQLLAVKNIEKNRK